MFNSGTHTGHESGGGGGVSGSVLIPTMFMWRHGGRNVLLCGSFTRWEENIPLSPVEGSSTLFQVVWNLYPGCHQYKFNVDGEWRHEENDPFANSDYGIVNTITVSTESDMAPTVASSEAPGSMDVDDFFMPVIPNFSKDDVEASRYRIYMYLTTNTAYNLLPESGKIVALDINLPVKQAFHILYEQGISVAPLWDSSKGQFVAVLTALDFILILRELQRQGPNLAEEELETHTIAAWKERKATLVILNEINVESSPRSFIHAGPHDSLKEVVVKILTHNVATVPIVQTSSEEGSFPQLLHLASLSGVLKCICRHFRHASDSLPILQQPIGAIPVGTWVPKIGEPNRRPFAMLKLSASLSDALSLLVEAQVSSIPIVDDNNSLLDIYSRSDITALAKDRTYAQISLDEMSLQQALRLGQDANSPGGFYNRHRCQMCLRSDTLHKVMERLTNPGVRRLVIVEAGSRRVEGIISLSDVFRFLLGLKE